MRQQAYPRAHRSERRRYWRNGAIVDVELWRDGKIMVTIPPALPYGTIDVDRCAAHGRPIYADLSCGICHERAIASQASAAAQECSAA